MSEDIRADQNGLTVTYTLADGTQVTLSGNRPFRNNNPGNVKHGPLAVRLGAIGRDVDGFAIFTSAEAGLAAQRAVLEKPSYQELTLDEAIEEYAPSSENNTAEYQAFVRNETDLTGDRLLSSLTAGEFDSLLTAMIKHEGGLVPGISYDPSNPPNMHRIQPGETLSEIARTYGLTVQQVLDANTQIEDPSRIPAGVNIIIPEPPSEDLHDVVPEEYGAPPNLPGPPPSEELPTPNPLPDEPPPAPASPLVLDLDGDGIETTGLDSAVYFDHDADGFLERTGFVSSDDGLLVLDRNADGVINSGREVFGDSTPLDSGDEASDGFAALAEFDENDDGVIDSSDAIFTDLRIWRDLDGDGHSDAGELFTPNAVGVAALNLGHSSSVFVDAFGNEHRLLGTYTTTGGQTREIADVFFATRRSDSKEEEISVSDVVGALPNTIVMGTVHSLHQAMMRDETFELQSLVHRFKSASTHEERVDLTTCVQRSIVNT